MSRRELAIRRARRQERGRLKYIKGAEARTTKFYGEKYGEIIAGLKIPPARMGKLKRRKLITRQLKRRGINKYTAYAIAFRIIK